MTELRANIFNRLRRAALIATLIGALLTVVALLQGLDRFLHSYLFAYCYWTGMGLGCLGILLLHYVAGGRWGALICRPLEAGALTLPLMFLLFAPIAFAMPHIYSWTRIEAQNDSAIQKSLYLNTWFFLARTFLYFLTWTLLAICLRNGSLSEDQKDARSRDRLNAISAPGILVYVLTASFAAMDWTMSLEPNWYSTIYGLILIAGHALLGMSLSILLMRFLRDDAAFNSVIVPQDFGDFGNVLLLFVLFSAYVSFSQFLIIWSGNLPDESSWYLRRSQGGWQWIAAVLAAFHFLIPFLILLFRSTKQNAQALSKVAILILVAHAVELYWLIMPAFEKSAIPHLSDFAALLLLGGIWAALFASVLQRAPLMPLNAPELTVSSEHKERIA